MEFLLDINVWSAFLTLTILEIVLGIDNIIFISLMVNRLPKHQHHAARQFGLLAAMFTRIALLLSIVWVSHLTDTLFSISWLNNHPVSGRDFILFFGGLYLIYQAVVEIHSSLEGEEEDMTLKKKHVQPFVIIILQIGLMDIIFSLDSVITAVGLADQIYVMIAAIVVSIGVMMFSAKAIGEFVTKHPSIKMLALSFLILVGSILIADGLGHHVPKGYLYFAIAFSLSVEMLNLKMRKKRSKQVSL